MLWCPSNLKPLPVPVHVMMEGAPLVGLGMQELTIVATHDGNSKVWVLQLHPWVRVR